MASDQEASFHYTKKRKETKLILIFAAYTREHACVTPRQNYEYTFFPNLFFVAETLKTNKTALAFSLQRKSHSSGILLPGRVHNKRRTVTH